MGASQGFGEYVRRSGYDEVIPYYLYQDVSVIREDNFDIEVATTTKVYMKPEYQIVI